MIARGISYGLFGPPGRVRDAGPGARRRPRPGVRVLGQVEPEPGTVRVGRRGCAAGPADRRRRGVDHGLLELAVGHPAGHRLPAAVARPRPRRVRRVRPPPRAPLPRPGAVLAVRQRAEQRRAAVGRHRAEYVPSSTRSTPPSATPTRTRRWCSAAAGTTCSAAPPDSAARQFFDHLVDAGRRRVRPVRRPPVRRPGTHPGHIVDTCSRDDAPARLREARSSPASTAGRCCSSSLSSTASCRRRSRPPLPSRAPIQSTRAWPRRPAQETPERRAHEGVLRADARPAAAAADVHGRLPGRAGGEAAPDQLPADRGPHGARARGRHPAHGVLAPRTRGPQLRTTRTR